MWIVCRLFEIIGLKKEPPSANVTCSFTIQVESFSSSFSRYLFRLEFVQVRILWENCFYKILEIFFSVLQIFLVKFSELKSLPDVRNLRNPDIAGKLEKRKKITTQGWNINIIIYKTECLKVWRRIHGEVWNPSRC